MCFMRYLSSPWPGFNSKQWWILQGIIPWLITLCRLLLVQRGSHHTTCGTTQPEDIEEEGLHPTMDRKCLKESLLDEHVFTIPFNRVFDRKKRWRWCIQHWTTWLKVCVSPCASSFAGFGLKCWIKEVYLEYQPLRPSYESSWKQATDLVKPSM